MPFDIKGIGQSRRARIHSRFAHLLNLLTLKFMPPLHAIALRQGPRGTAFGKNDGAIPPRPGTNTMGIRCPGTGSPFPRWALPWVVMTNAVTLGGVRTGVAKQNIGFYNRVMAGNLSMVSRIQTTGLEASTPCRPKNTAARLAATSFRICFFWVMHRGRFAAPVAAMPDLKKVRHPKVFSRAFPGTAHWPKTPTERADTAGREPEKPISNSSRADGPSASGHIRRPSGRDRHYRVNRDTISMSLADIFFSVSALSLTWPLLLDISCAWLLTTAMSWVMVPATVELWPTFSLTS